jgi:hypothetical protein
LLRFWKSEITLVLCSKASALIHYHGVIPHWKGIYTVKMNLSWLAIALLLLAVSAPASLMAAMSSGSDSNPNGAPPITYPTPLPPDGNPNGPI